MHKVKESQSSQEIELSSTSAVSPDPMANEEVQMEVTKSVWKCYWKQCTFIALLVICSFMLGFETNAQQISDDIPTVNFLTPEGFIFLAHCPISYLNQETSFQGIPPYNTNSSDDELRRRRLYESYNKRIEVDKKSFNNYIPNRTYLVEVTSRNITVDGASTSLLFYCGLTRQLFQDCNKSFIACSSPGPIFDIPVRQPIDIIWVNNLNPESLPDMSETCMEKNYDGGDTLVPNYCHLMVKKNHSQTFIDPTQMGMSSSAFLEKRITRDTWPMVTHLHGAEIRPTFDGNPLSWIDNQDQDKGQFGIATFSLEEDCYYEAFDEVDGGQTYTPPKIILRDIRNNKITKNFKINRYPNRQNPGTLWYHDHAMHLTSYNVKYGLSGFYILRDELVEQQIGIDPHNERIVMLAQFGFLHNVKATFGQRQLPKFQQGTIYRFKFLNNWFDQFKFHTPRISFSYRNCSDDIRERQTFSIIGADSSLFDVSIDNQVSFTVSQAERLELLIQFDGNQTEFAICADQNITQFPNPAGHHGSSQGPKFEHITGIKLGQKKATFPNNRTSINNVQLNVPFTNLSLTPEEDIAKIRMRPLMWIGNPFSTVNHAGAVFTINGRTSFHGGYSENPTLGTTEDWFLINNIPFGHPIHVHLLNFEVIREYSLRYLTPRVPPPNLDPVPPTFYSCGFYEMDFVLAAMNIAENCNSQLATHLENIYVNGTIDYYYLCNNVKNIQTIPCVVQALSTVFPEDKFDPITRVGGIDVRQKLTPEELPFFLNTEKYTITPPVDPNQVNPYKYVSDEGKPSPKPYYARWKDTALVEAFRVLQYRIRWTKSNYTEADKAAGTYFHVPNDQLREYPGFIYHCHILPHEDNEMMRPIMVQLPPGADLDEETPCNYNIESKKKVLSWKDKYNCLNKRCGNKPT